MSQENIQFKFPAEENPFKRLSSLEEKKSAGLVFKMICVPVLCIGLGLAIIPHKLQNITPQRTVQNVNTPSPSVYQIVNINPFFIFLKSQEVSQLTKLNVEFQVDNLKVSEEIKKSASKIKNHLIFILSHKELSIFLDKTSREYLKRKIITQLNVFLVTGKIQNIHITETFFN